MDRICTYLDEDIGRTGFTYIQYNDIFNSMFDKRLKTVILNKLFIKICCNYLLNREKSFNKSHHKNKRY